ncbi:MAG TPA: alpha/beta hydrolase fold domain-containing protein [Sphingomonas sp.]|nr:alpha/beta hydrolase fold domain-containing protein [Sphingomonas sp.]
MRHGNRSSRRLAATLLLGGSALLATLPGPAAAQRAPDPDGTVHVELSVPISTLASPEGGEFLRKVIVDKPFDNPAGPARNIAEERAWQNKIMGDFLKPMRQRYNVEIHEERIGGVVADIVTPAGGVKPENKDRVLINLHGGGFITGGRSASLVESVPIASVMGIKVVSVDYRMGPEFKFPAASEDVANVYRELLKHYDPQKIGIYGCSAGGMLTGQAIAWFQANKLPNPAAIGIFCASLGGLGQGDSARLAMPLNGVLPRPTNATEQRPAAPTPQSYLGGARPDDPLAFPGSSESLLRKFPPTLFITGTRAFEMSGTITSNNALAMAGVESRLHVWDGMIHGFFYNSEIPESRAAYKIVADFFDSHLKR